MLPLAPVAASVATAAAMKIGSIAVTKIGHLMASHHQLNSLADLSKPARVEPIVIVEESLANQPYMLDIMHTCTSIFTAQYLQAVAMIMDVGRIDTLGVFDSLNPNRSVGSATKTLKDAVFSQETYEHGLPSMESFNEPMEPGLIAATGMEAENTPSLSENEIKKVYERESLAVGKLVSVTFRDGDHTAKLPVQIRLIPATVPSPVLTHIFTATSKNSSWTERWHLWRSGQIRMVRDLMFQIDMADEHRKALTNDNSNVYMTIMDRRRNNMKAAAITGAPSMADASNIAIISSETAKNIGRELYGSLDQLSIRKKIFDATYLTLLIVVEERWERVRIYHRGMVKSTDLSFKDIKSIEKNKGPDITEILAAYRLGTTPL